MQEEKVGGLLFRRGAPEVDDDPYRDARAAQLEIRSGGGAVANDSGPGAMMLLVMVLSTGLLVFAVIVRSIPAMATVAAALSAMAWLVFRRRTRVVSSASVVLGPEGVRVETAERTLTTTYEEVEAVGIGESGATRTIFLQISGEGRLLLFEGLEENEATAAESALEEAIERRRNSA